MSDATISIRSSDMSEPMPDPVGPTQPGDLNDSLIDTDIWTDEMVADAGIPIIDITFVTVGGGIGSFVIVDFLRIYGCRPASIRVLTQLDTPWQTYEYLTRVSQIPRTERLRSDSQSHARQHLGLPELRRPRGVGKPRRRSPRCGTCCTEPILSDYYTPKAGQAFETMEREDAPDRLPAVRARARCGWSGAARAAATSPS